MSCVTCHMSHVMCHMSRVTCKIFFLLIFFGQSGESSRWRVCYQRGLPRLVSISPVMVRPSFSVIFSGWNCCILLTSSQTDPDPYLKHLETPAWDFPSWWAWLQWLCFSAVLLQSPRFAWMDWVNLSKRGGMKVVFRGLAGPLWGIFQGKNPQGQCQWAALPPEENPIIPNSFTHI